MNRISIFTTAAFLAATPAFAEEAHNSTHGEHEAREQESHDHEDHKHDGDDPSADDAAPLGAPLQRTPEIETALSAGGEPAVVDVLGVVCDFCAKAMNKTFGKRDEVAAVYVDLDSKTLNLVFKPSMTLADEVIHSLVKKAGYKAASIRRGDAALKGTDDASDAT